MDDRDVLAEAAGRSDEAPEHTVKRLKMRAWHRGTQEMDLILGPYADARLAGMDRAALLALDRLMAENDQDLYRWVTGQANAPDIFAGLIADIAEFARTRLAGA